jgi:predicted aspartyl protease
MLIRGLTLLALAAILAPTSDGMAAAAESAGKMVRIADLPVRIAKNKLIVDGAINGQKIGIAVDTGAMVTLMFRQAADRLKLERRDARAIGSSASVARPKRNRC